MRIASPRSLVAAVAALTVLAIPVAITGAFADDESVAAAPVAAPRATPSATPAPRPGGGAGRGEARPAARRRHARSSGTGGS